MSGVNFSVIESKSLQLGNNKFEQGTLSVAAGTTIKAGTILMRGGERQFAIAADEDDVPVGIVPFDMKNESTATVNLGFRAIIGGEVRKDMLNLNGDASITSAIVDSLRDHCGIIAVDTTDVSRVSPEA